MAVTTSFRKKFTQRQLHVIAGVVDGLTNRQIASRLGVSVHVVGNDLREIRSLMGVTSRSQVAVVAFEAGMRPTTYA